MQELQARLQLLIERRKLLATVASREHRPWTEDEIDELASLNGAIDAVIYTIRELSPPAPPQQPAPSGETGISVQDFRDARQAFHSVQKDGWKFAMEQVGQYGRWLIATVAAAHFGGLVLVAQLAERLPTADLRSTMWCLIAGLVAIFISGLVTYYNWGYSGRFFALHTNVRLLIDPSEPLPDGTRELKMMTVTQFAAIGLGVVSVAFIPLAAWQLPL